MGRYGRSVPPASGITLVFGAPPGVASRSPPRRSPGVRGDRNPWGARRCHDEAVPVTVLIVDDHDDFRRSARALLEAEGLLVTGEARNGAEALARARSLRPDLVLLDIQLPDVDGFAVAEELLAWSQPPTVVLISSRQAASYGARLAATSASGFLGKSRLSSAALVRFLPPT